jgi:hypothetical protein
MEIKDGILVEEFKNNIIDVKCFENPEANIKFKSIEDYEKFMNLIDRRYTVIEENQILLIKERIKLSKIKDKKEYIFNKLKSFLRELGYKKEITLESSPVEISKEICNNDSSFWNAGYGIDTYFNIPYITIFSRNTKTIGGIVESIMNELVDYDLFPKYASFKWDINDPLRFLLYMMSHVYLCNKSKVTTFYCEDFYTKMLRFHSLGCVGYDINSPNLEITLEMNKSRLIQKFDYILATVRYNGTRYSVRGFVDSGFVSQDGLFKHYDVFNIELISCPWNELPTKENSKKIVLDISNHHRDFPLVEYILKLKDKIETDTYIRHPLLKD